MTDSRVLHPTYGTRPPAADLSAIVRGAAAGDPDAVEQLLMRAQEVAYRFSLLVCGHPEDAEDVMQDALLRTYQRVHQLHEPDAFRAWLYRTVRNACLMKRRRRVGEPAQHVPIEAEPDDRGGTGRPAIDVASSEPGVDEGLMQAAAGLRVRKALMAIPPAFRAIVVLRDVEGLSTREVATVLGLSEANVKTRLHRARGALRRVLESMP